MDCDWPTCPLGRLVKFTSGGTPSKKDKGYWNGDIPWISAKSLKSERITTADLFISKDGLKAGSRIAPVGSILLLTRGSGLFRSIPLGIVEKEVAFNQDIKCIDTISDIENEFIFYWLMSKRDYLMAKVGVTGIGAGKFDLDVLRELEVPIPSKSEREKIVKIAGGLSQKIEINSKINDNLPFTMSQVKPCRYQPSGARSRKAVYRHGFIGRTPDSSRPSGRERSRAA